MYSGFELRHRETLGKKGEKVNQARQMNTPPLVVIAITVPL
jgi:hypothetical protein